ncbi:hypothetical protein B0H12DRAFT_375897 [Mycena haematopus]|nr:hypothetical protein B0H12DRAFT_375897 [Mycena haematopus]
MDNLALRPPSFLVWPHGFPSGSVLFRSGHPHTPPSSSSQSDLDHGFFRSGFFAQDTRTLRHPLAPGLISVWPSVLFSVWPSRSGHPYAPPSSSWSDTTVLFFSSWLSRLDTARSAFLSLLPVLSFWPPRFYSSGLDLSSWTPCALRPPLPPPGLPFGSTPRSFYLVTVPFEFRPLLLIILFSRTRHGTRLGPPRFLSSVLHTSKPRKNYKTRKHKQRETSQKKQKTQKMIL